MMSAIKARNLGEHSLREIWFTILMDFFFLTKRSALNAVMVRNCLGLVININLHFNCAQKT